PSQKIPFSHYPFTPKVHQNHQKGKQKSGKLKAKMQLGGAVDRSGKTERIAFDAVRNRVCVFVFV
ncbi:hypothetical protein LINPERPRIM_LOCUS24309, partial [Linum perenne]